MEARGGETGGGVGSAQGEDSMDFKGNIYIFYVNPVYPGYESSQALIT